MALDISAAQARDNMAAVREQWVATHLGQISALISAASDSGKMTASYELHVGESEEAGLEEVVAALAGQGFDVLQRGKHSAPRKAVRKSVLRTAAGIAPVVPVPEDEPGCVENVVLDISWAEEAEESEEPAGFILPRTPAPLI